MDATTMVNAMNKIECEHTDNNRKRARINVNGERVLLSVCPQCLDALIAKLNLVKTFSNPGFVGEI
jgi:hypothetical protein